MGCDLKPGSQLGGFGRKQFTVALSKPTIVRLLTLAAGLALVLSLPISNLFIQRTTLASADDPEFKAVSDILVRKCADCHTKDMAEYPLYFSLPLASSIMHRNIERAQSVFLIDKTKLSGKVKFTAEDVQRLNQAMAKGDMPPMQYLFLHWDAALTDREQRRLVNWIQKRTKEFDIRAIPNENFFNPDARKAALGKKLFNEKLLSTDNSRSCASCHALDKGGTDNLRTPMSVDGKVDRYNTPTVFNAAYNFAQYWNGRAKDLTEQAGMAIESPAEMGSTWEQVLTKLGNDNKYRAEFKSCYNNGISKENICDAISQYEHTLLTPESRFDKYLAGDLTALSSEEKEGFELFKKHDCASCHAGPALGGLSFEKLGAKHDFFDQNEKPSDNDEGRFEVTHSLTDKYRFKVPTLRNVELTYPYFHDGSIQSLEEAVKKMSDTQIDTPLNASEVKKVAAFLRTLTKPGDADAH